MIMTAAARYISHHVTTALLLSMFLFAWKLSGKDAGSMMQIIRRGYDENQVLFNAC
jgi:hypothetical protein